MGDLMQAKRQWAILWPDGSVLSADTPGGLLNRLALLQWDQPCSEAQLRARLIDRAKAWNGAIVSEDLSDEDFLVSLSTAGMFALNTPWTLQDDNTTTTTAKEGK